MKQKAFKELWGWCISIGTALILAILIKTYIASSVLVDGDSMMPTLQSKERMVLNKFGTKINGLERNDIVVLHAPDGRNYIKRVIGLPNDTVEVRDNELYVNGKKIAQPYIDKIKYQNEYYTSNFTLEKLYSVKKVPKNQYFVMGDHRGVSKDSRDVTVGFVQKDKIIGKTSVVYWPPSSMRTVN